MQQEINGKLYTPKELGEFLIRLDRLPVELFDIAVRGYGAWYTLMYLYLDGPLPAQHGFLSHEACKFDSNLCTFHYEEISKRHRMIKLLELDFLFANAVLNQFTRWKNTSTDSLGY